MDQLSLFVVDDDETYLQLMNARLTKAGIKNIQTFSSGEQCLEGLAANPDMILLDYQMEGMDGIETLKKIKMKKPNVQVIFLSANDSPEVADAALLHGAYDYVVKNDAAYGRTKLLIKRIIRLNKSLKEEKAAKKLKVVIVIILVFFFGIMCYMSYLFPSWFH